MVIRSKQYFKKDLNQCIGKYKMFNTRMYCDNFIRNISDEILYVLRQLPNADEISSVMGTGHYDEVILLAENIEGGMRTAVLWACWLGRSTLLNRLLKLGVDPNEMDDAGR